jgi:hypothetical protein
MNKKIIIALILLSSIAFYAQAVMFAPKDIRKAVMNDISNANKSVLILTDIVSDSDIADSIIKSKEAGIEVTVIVNSSSLDKNYSLHKMLFNSGVKLLSFNSDYSLNNTIIITDEKNILIGSFPLSLEKYFHNDFCVRVSDRESADSCISRFRAFESKSEAYSLVADTLEFDDIAGKMKDYANKEVFINGYVSDVSKSGKSNTYFLKMKKGKNVLTIVFFDSFVKALEKKSVSPMYFKNKDILINGLLINHEKYGFEIIPSDVSQIKIYID